jgi:multidrug efflux pump subunit AcrA (membrane-fusion protein)
MQVKRTGVALVVVTVVLVAGCGGSSSPRLTKAQYEAKIQADGKAVQDAVDKISSDIPTIKSIAKEVAVAEAEAKKAADDLDAANPPKEVAADNDKLVSAMRAIDVQLVQLAKAAKDGDAVAAQQAVNGLQLSPEVKAGQVAIDDMKKQGYKVGVLGK